MLGLIILGLKYSKMNFILNYYDEDYRQLNNLFIGGDNM